MNEQIKQYLVQVRCPDGHTYSAMMPYPAIIDKVGMTDCSGEEIVVYDVSEFGKVKRLNHKTATQRPNWHIFYLRGDNTHEDAIVFSGESPEH